MRAGQIDRFAATLRRRGQPRDARRAGGGVRGELGAVRGALEARTPASTRPPTPSTSSCERLGIDRPRRAAGAADRRRSARWGSGATSMSAPGIAECLAGLAGRGRAAGHRVRRRPHVLADAARPAGGVRAARCFDAWAFSDETGWFKPAPEAFAPALEGSASRIPTRWPTWATIAAPTWRAPCLGYDGGPLHGARPRPDARLGDRSGGHHVIDDHRDLAAALGLVEVAFTSRPRRVVPRCGTRRRMWFHQFEHGYARWWRRTDGRG